MAWNFSSDAEKLEEVVELAVNVTANGHGRSDGLHVALFQKALLDLEHINHE